MPEVEMEKVESAQNTLRNGAIPKPQESRGHLETVNADQTSARWGTEPGPQLFQKKFQNFLSEAESQLTLLQTKLEQYDVGLQSTVDAFRETDSDIAAQNAIYQGEAEAAAVVEQKESELANSETAGDAPTAEQGEGGAGPEQGAESAPAADDNFASTPDADGSATESQPNEAVAAPGAGPVPEMEE